MGQLMLFEDAQNNELVLFDESFTDNLQPHEMTLAQFLADSRWWAYPDPKATGESKGMYVLEQPDGSFWRGGWIGKYRSEEQAKTEFHRKQLYWKIHWRDSIKPYILMDYPDLAKSQQYIEEVMKRIVLLDSGYGYIEIEGRKRIFCIEDYPINCRVSGREFCRYHDLVDPVYPINDELFKSMNALEITTIAMERKIQDVLPSDHCPIRFSSKYREGEQIVYRKVTDLDKNGMPIAVEKTGKVIQVIGSVFLNASPDGSRTEANPVFKSEVIEK